MPENKFLSTSSTNPFEYQSETNHINLDSDDHFQSAYFVRQCALLLVIRFLLDRRIYRSGPLFRLSDYRPKGAQKVLHLNYKTKKLAL